LYMGYMVKYAFASPFSLCNHWTRRVSLPTASSGSTSRLGVGFPGVIFGMAYIFTDE